MFEDLEKDFTTTHSKLFFYVTVRILWLFVFCVGFSPYLFLQCRGCWELKVQLMRVNQLQTQKENGGCRVCSHCTRGTLAFLLLLDQVKYSFLLPWSLCRFRFLRVCVAWILFCSNDSSGQSQQRFPSGFSFPPLLDSATLPPAPSDKSSPISRKITHSIHSKYFLSLPITFTCS